MDNLRDQFDRLDAHHKYQVQLLLCQHALTIWEAYAQLHAPIEYVDSVVGMLHRVDTTLPRDALTCVQHNTAADVAQRYYEPMVALQDADLVLPEHIEYAYYAIYNLYKKYLQGAAIDDWLIVNQALSAEQDPAQWRILLTTTMMPFATFN